MFPVRKFFGFGHLRLQPLPQTFRYGPPVPALQDNVYAARPQLYAVLQNVRSQATHVVTYEDTPEGRAALSAQCRVEKLVKLILGHHVQVEAGQRLDFVSGDGSHSDYRRSSIT